MPPTTVDPALVSIVFTAVQAHLPTAPTLAQAEEAVGTLFGQLGPRLIEEALQAGPDPEPAQKGGVRLVRAATACATSAARPAR